MGDRAGPPFGAVDDAVWRIRRFQTAAVARSAGTAGLGYGFVLDWADRDAVEHWRIHTLGGEALWLSVELLARLAGVPLLRDDWTTCELLDPLAHDVAGRPRFRDPTTILRALRTRQNLGDHISDPRGVPLWLDVDEIVRRDRTRCRVFLCSARPPGWPP